MALHSYHIFYFPFRWYLPSNVGKSFSQQVELNNIPIETCTKWERAMISKKNSACLEGKDLQEARELFAEKQYYYEFVHPVLYDMEGESHTLIHHYERQEPKLKEVFYEIQAQDRTYRLRLEAMNLNLYATGVGVMSFYLANESDRQSSESDIRNINQFGRRIMPPHSAEFDRRNRKLIASHIKILGLEGAAGKTYGDAFDYKDCPKGNEKGLDDVWRPADFIMELISDLSSDLKVVPVIDDRMLVNCWYANNELASQVVNKAKDCKDDFVKGDFWYKYVFVDNGNDETCQNEKMKENLLENATYLRWQKYGTLYGVSRYSFVVLVSEKAPDYIQMHMRTIYSRMMELVLVQRASMLRFSAEVTRVSALTGGSNKEVAYSIGSLYREYIRFVNQIYFRSITAQDQGIELYEMLMRQFELGDQIKDLDEEISELNQYITLMVDQNRNENGEKLNLLAALFLPATLLTGIYGMNRYVDLEATADFWAHIVFIIAVSLIGYYLINKWRK